MIISLYRPSPQVPKPTSNAALKCFEASRSIIDLTSRQIEDGTADITWESLLTVYASLNALLWSISYPEVRTEHTREDVQDLAAAALEAIKIFSDRWPGSSSAVQLYTVIANACLQSYNVEEETPSPPSTSQLGTPVSLAGPISPESDASRNTPTQSATSIFNTSSPFGYLFDAANDALAAQYGFDNDAPPFQHQPTFRSNSIFMSPSTDANGRRLSHLAPDSSDASGPERLGNTPPPPLIIPKQEPMPPTTTATFNSLPTPPESLVPPPAHPIIGLSPRLTTATAQTTPIQTPHLHPASPAPGPQHHPSPIPQVKQQPLALFAPPHFKQEHHHQQQQQQSRPAPPPTFITPPPPSHPHPQPATQQRPPPPTTAADWYNPLPQFVPPHAFTNGMNNPSFWTGTPNPFHGPGVPSGQQHYPGARNGLHQPARGNPETNWNLGWGAGSHHEGGFAPSPGFGPGLAPPAPGGGEYYNSFISLRNGSLSQEQQMELMDVLETEGMNDIDSFLNMGLGIAGQGHGGHGGHVHWG